MDGLMQRLVLTLHKGNPEMAYNFLKQHPDMMIWLLLRHCEANVFHLSGVTHAWRTTYCKILLTSWERLSFVSAWPFFKSSHVYLLWLDNSGSYREITTRKEVGGNFIDNSITFFVFFLFFKATMFAAILCVVTQRFSLTRCVAWQVLIWH